LLAQIADPTQAAVDAVMAIAYEAIRTASDNATERIEKVEAAQKELYKALENIVAIQGITMDSPIYRQANADLVTALGQYIRGDGAQKE